MPNRLQDKIAIVTGSSSGLGRAIALLYAKEGASVLCADLRPKARMNLGNEGEVNTHDLIVAEGGKAVFVRCDVGKTEDWEEVVRKCVQVWGRIDMQVFPSLILLKCKLCALFSHRKQMYCPVQADFISASSIMRVYPSKQPTQHPSISPRNKRGIKPCS